jgi:adenylosuccinate synthase
LDLVALRHAVRVNGLTELAITKLDILSRFDEILVCVAYDLGDRRIESFPVDQEVLARCRPVYESLPGWSVDITEIRSFPELPSEARNYVTRLEELLAIHASTISVGPGREQTIRW